MHRKRGECDAYSIVICFCALSDAQPPQIKQLNEIITLHLYTTTRHAKGSAYTSNISKKITMHATWKCLNYKHDICDRRRFVDEINLNMFFSLFALFIFLEID